MAEDIKGLSNPNSEIVIYQNDDGTMKIDVTLEDNTVWLSQQQMAELFGTSRTNVVEHIRNIYSEGELDENSTCRNFRQVRTEGNREVARNIPYYNLDMIISLGYRVKSIIATRFRQWATERLDKATAEYKKYQARTLSEVEKDYLDAIKSIDTKINKRK